MGKLSVGAAKRCITPSAAILKEIAKENKKYNFDGVLEDIYVRVLYLTNRQINAVIIVGDLNRFPFQNDLAKVMEERHGITPGCCIFGCTRNHHTPNGTSWEENPPWLRKYREDFVVNTPAQKKYEDYVINATEEAVMSAISNAVPARMGYTVTTSNINSYRDWITEEGYLESQDLDGHRDPTLVVARFEDLSEKTIGVFVNYAMRGCMLPVNSSDFHKVNADIPGAISRFVEKTGKDEFPVLWACGGGADQDIIVKSDVEYLDVDENGQMTKVHKNLPIDAVLMIRQKFASAQGLRILEAMRKINNYTDNLVISSFETVRRVPARVAYNELGIKPKPGIRPEPTPHPYEPVLPLRMRMTVINGMAFLGVNGEAYTRIWKHIKENMPIEVCAIIDISYGHLGCIPDEQGDLENGYGGRSTYVIIGQAAENAMLDGFRELSNKYMENIGSL